MQRNEILLSRGGSYWMTPSNELFIGGLDLSNHYHVPEDVNLIYFVTSSMSVPDTHHLFLDTYYLRSTGGRLAHSLAPLMQIVRDHGGSCYFWIEYNQQA